MKILVIYHVYNEMTWLPIQYNWVKNNGLDIYIVDHTSNDGTWEWIQENNIPSHRFDNGGSYHLGELQDECLKVLHELKPDWVIYGDPDSFFILDKPIREEIEIADKEGFAGVATTTFNIFNTGEEFNSNHIKTYHYGSKLFRTQTRIVKYFKKLKFNGDIIELENKRLAKATEGLLINYGGTKESKQREEYIERHKKAWDSGMNPAFGTHLLKGKELGWKYDKKSLTNITTLPWYHNFLSQIKTPDLLTHKRYLSDINKFGQCKHWHDKFMDLEVRWEYHKLISDLVAELNPLNILEAGTMGVKISSKSDTLEYDVQDVWKVKKKLKPTYYHDLTNIPYPIVDRQYDLFIAIRVYQHLQGDLKTYFKELIRISNQVILGLPKKIDIKRLTHLEPNRIVSCNDTDTVIYYWDLSKIKILTEGYTVIIPTMWVNTNLLHNMLLIYQDEELIKQIIIIDNEPSKGLKLDNLNKVRIISKGENIIVNPAWNWGVEETKTNKIIIVNDDILITQESFKKVIRLIDKNLEPGVIIGPYKTCYKRYGLDTGELRIEDGEKITSWGFGTFMFMYTESYVNIPHYFKVWVGDEIQYYCNKPKVIKGFEIVTKMSETVNQQSGIREMGELEHSFYLHSCNKDGSMKEKINREGYTSKVEIRGDKVYKTVDCEPHTKNLVKREVYWLEKLSKTGIVPKLYEVIENLIIMEYCGEPLTTKNTPSDIQDQLFFIIKTLLENHCYYNDLKLSNLLVRNNKLFIIDFGWCPEILEDYTIHGLIQTDLKEKPYGNVFQFPKKLDNINSNPKYLNKSQKRENPKVKIQLIQDYNGHKAGETLEVRLGVAQMLYRGGKCILL